MDEGGGGLVVALLLEVVLDEGVHRLSECGTHTAVKPRIWPWLEPSLGQKVGGCRDRANMAHIRHPRPHSGLGFQIKVHEPL